MDAQRRQRKGRRVPDAAPDSGQRGAGLAARADVLVCGAPPHAPSGEIISPDPPCFVWSGCRKAGRGRGVGFDLQRIRHSRLRPSLPPTLRHRPPHSVPGRLHRIEARPPSPPRSQRLPRRAFCVPPVPVSCVFPFFITLLGCSPPLPSSPHPRQSRPAFPAAPPAHPASSLPPPLTNSRPNVPFPAAPVGPHSRRALLLQHARPSAAPRPDPLFSAPPHRSHPLIPLFSPLLPQSLPRRYFFFMLFANVDFFIDL